jgi:folate-dependent phosphoribosylglycinamide formyltransferase PurN
MEESSMRPPLKFVVLTSSDVGAGTVLEYLCRTTGVQIARVYLDTLREKKRPTPPTSGGPHVPFFRKLRYHAALAVRLPRQYAFRLVERGLGASELDVLRALERLHPGLLRLAAGVAPADLPRGRLLYRLRETAQARGIPVVETPSLNSAATVAALRDEQADVFLGIGTRILSKDVLGAARLGVLNAHSSLLPEYRGGTTEFWQLAAGERETGITVHWMAPQVDAGEVCAQRSWPVPRGASHYQLRLLSLLLRLDVWREVVERLLRGEVPRQAQGSARTPTFRHPDLAQLYGYYCRGQSLGQILG